MTFFINEPESPPVIKANNPDIDLDGGWFGGLSAAISASALENDANFVARRTVGETQASTGWDLANRIGVDAISERALSRGMSQHSVDLFTKMMQRRPPNMPEAMRALVFDMASEAASSDPKTWADLDFSEEAIEARANAKLQAEHEDAQLILEMMPNGQGAARFLGGMIGITADVKNIPFLLLGGGSGSIMRVAGREAVINMAAETAFLPSQFEMAQRLNIPDPSVAQQLALAGIAGGAIGGAVEAGSRGLTYLRLRNQIPQFPDHDPITARAMVDEAEDILTSDTPRPFEQIERLRRDTPKSPPYLLENPLNPMRPPLVKKGAANRIDLPDEAIPELLQTAIDDASAADRKAARPLAQYLRDNHKQGGENLQIHPEGQVGEELKAAGITPQTMPGLFSRKGRKDLDNLAATEMEELFPGITEASGTQRGALYLDRDGLVDVIRRDLERDTDWLQTRAEVHRLEAELEGFPDGQASQNVIDDIQMGAKADYGFFVDLNHYEFLHGNYAADQIARDLDGYLAERWAGGFFSPEERAELLEHLQRNGGDAEYLVEQMAAREIDQALMPATKDVLDDIPFGDDATPPKRDVGQSTDSSGRPGSDTRAEEPSQPRAGNAEGPRTEQTAAGQQIVAPGVEPITQKERLEAAQRSPLRGGDRPVDDGLFDSGARAQTDMFSDPSSAEARIVQDNVAADFRHDIEVNGATEVGMITEDGRILRTDQDVLDYLDEGDNFSARIDLCGKGPA